MYKIEHIKEIEKDISRDIIYDEIKSNKQLIWVLL